VTDPDRRARFEREARMLAAVNHPNIAAIYGIEDSSGTHALVMELVEGHTLAELIQANVELRETRSAASTLKGDVQPSHLEVLQGSLSSPARSPMRSLQRTSTASSIAI
jgi:serine/threonine protein kinase